MVDFGAWVKETLAEKGMTQKILAELLGTDEKRISFWVNGYNKPRLDTVQEILDVLGYHLEFAKGRTEE